MDKVKLRKLCITPKIVCCSKPRLRKSLPMKQAALSPSLDIKKTRKRRFLEQMNQVVPWAALVELMAPYYPEGRTGRPPFELETMLRTHFMQQWFTLSDPAMEEAFFDTPLYREFAQLDEWARLPDESTILRFRHRLEKHKLAEQILDTVNALLTERGLLLKVGTAIDATLIAAPTSTKNKGKARDPEMHSSKKGKQWYKGQESPYRSGCRLWPGAQRAGYIRAYQ
jgi:IS5 family transposase